MTRQDWYSLYRDVRTPVIGTDNLFPQSDRAGIALAIAFHARKQARKEAWEQSRKPKN